MLNTFIFWISYKCLIITISYYIHIRFYFFFQFLYRAGLAPDLYATFNNGMVYKYIKGETLTTSTVRDPSIYRLVAKTMARFHRLGTSGISAEDGAIKSELWNKMEQFANLIPKRFSSPSNDLQLVHKKIIVLIIISAWVLKHMLILMS